MSISERYALFKIDDELRSRLLSFSETPYPLETVCAMNPISFETVIIENGRRKIQGEDSGDG